MDRNKIYNIFENMICEVEYIKRLSHLAKKQ